MKTNHTFVTGLATLGLLSAACGGADDPPPPQRTAQAQQTAPADSPPPSNPATTPQPQTAEPAPAARAPAPQAPAAQGRVTEAEVSAFSQVHLELTGLRQQAAIRVQQGEEVEQVQAELDQRVGMIFQESPLTPERYEEIGQRASADEVLRARIERDLATRQPPPGRGGGAGAGGAR